MSDSGRERRTKQAQRAIDADGHAVCVCGQLFFEAGAYADHVDQCEHVERQRMAARD